MQTFLPWVQDNLPTNSYYDVFRRFLEKPFNPHIPTIGIYGKAGTVKGTFDLVQALGLLKKQRVPFQFLALNQGSEATLAAFASSIEEHDLSDVTWLLPFLPHWSVPQFIRSCLVVCFLERDFPIPIHTPLIPQEVFACGTCQILSHEIAQKQTYHARLEHGRNVYLVGPHDHQDLATILNTVVSHPEASRHIGRQGYDDIGRDRGQFAAEVDAWGNLFTRIHSEVQQRRNLMSIAEMQSYLAQLYTDDSLRRLFSLDPDVSFEGYLLSEEEKQSLRAIDRKLLEYFATSLKMKQLERLRSIYPATFTLPQSLLERLFDRFYHHFPVHSHDETLMRIDQFGVFFEQSLAIDELAPCYASDIVRYERLRYYYTYQPTLEDAFSAINAPLTVEGPPFKRDASLVLLPGVYRETFSYPVVDLVAPLVQQQPLDDHLMQPGHYHLVFQRERHSLTMNVFTLNEETALLLDICQQKKSVEDVIREAEQQLGETDLADDILAMLALLQEKHLVGVHE
ncbi:PqqD family peptide modification chaperone [Ktedonobacter robiniae]|nr:PqqD family peptide modification chaperone [Ktedonobacter robiniae]